MAPGFEKAKRTVWQCGSLLLVALLLPSAISLGQTQPPAKPEPAPIRPFKMHVPDRVLIDLRRRLAEANWPDQLPGTTWEYGADIKKVRELADYWQNGYDWRAQEAKINQLDQFTTEIDGQQIYFIHQRSPRPDAIPLMLEYRHHDKSNQLGDLAQDPYSDWTGYAPVNTPSPVPVRAAPSDPNRWQPLTYVSSTGDLMTQRFVGAQWCDVTPLARAKGDEYRWLTRLFGPATYGSKEYQEQAEELIAMSAALSGKQKMISEYWSDGPNSEQPPGHWALFAQFVSARDHHPHPRQMLCGWGAGSG
jgi:hypothetical protein